MPGVTLYTGKRTSVTNLAAKVCDKIHRFPEKETMKITTKN
jgi:hypothetical protein